MNLSVNTVINAILYGQTHIVPEGISEARWNAAVKQVWRSLNEENKL